MKKLIFVIILNLFFVSIALIDSKANMSEPDCNCPGTGYYIGPKCKMQSLPGPCPGGGWGIFSKCVLDSEFNLCNCDNEGNNCGS